MHISTPTTAQCPLLRGLFPAQLPYLPCSYVLPLPPSPRLPRRTARTFPPGRRARQKHCHVCQPGVSLRLFFFFFGLFVSAFSDPGGTYNCLEISLAFLVERL